MKEAGSFYITGVIGYWLYLMFHYWHVIHSASDGAYLLGRALVWPFGFLIWELS